MALGPLDAGHRHVGAPSRGAWRVLIPSGRANPPSARQAQLLRPQTRLLDPIFIKSRNSRARRFRSRVPFVGETGRETDWKNNPVRLAGEEAALIVRLRRLQHFQRLTLRRQTGCGRLDWLGPPLSRSRLSLGIEIWVVVARGTQTIAMNYRKYSTTSMLSIGKRDPARNLNI